MRFRKVCPETYQNTNYITYLEMLLHDGARRERERERERTKRKKENVFVK
jgi:hypothetical protein